MSQFPNYLISFLIPMPIHREWLHEKGPDMARSMPRSMAPLKRKVAMLGSLPTAMPSWIATMLSLPSDSDEWSPPTELALLDRDLCRCEEVALMNPSACHSASPPPPPSVLCTHGTPALEVVSKTDVQPILLINLLYAWLFFRIRSVL